jgi:FAD-dependent urate hydroxylase
LGGSGTSPSSDYDVVVIGAGPYGLSVGVHLKGKGLSVRVFGDPMGFWANKMPAGMLLRSPREASNLSDPRGVYSLEAFEEASGTAPVAPLPLNTFVEYGLWFRRQLGSDLEATTVTQIDRVGSHFRCVLEDGRSVTSRRVVISAGIESFKRIPDVFAGLRSGQASHCYDGRKVASLVGKRVAVIGAGQSALESAALLHEAGSEVEIIAAISRLRWIGQHSWLHHMGPISKMLYSGYDVGPAGISRLVANPDLVRQIPLRLRDRIRKRAVRPAGSTWLPERLSSVKTSTGRTVGKASSVGDEVHLKLDDGSERSVDHVLLGTGYSVDIQRYAFLAPELLQVIERRDGYPVLGPGFSSSVPGLHFIGATAARSFGPLLYFVAGTEFAARALTKYVERNRIVSR